MVSEPAVVETEVQAEAAPEQAPEESISPEGDASEVAEAVLSSDEAEAEPKHDVISSLTEEDIERLVKSERLESWKQTERNAGAQAKEAELRRIAGSDDNTMSRVQQLMEAARRNPDNKQTQESLAQAIKGNKEWAQTDILQRLPDALLAHYEVSQPVIKKAMEWFHAGSMDKYVTTIVDAAVEAQVSAKVDSAAEKRAEAMLQDMIKAHERESGQKLTAPPTTPTGQAGGSDGKISVDEWTSASSAQRAQWTREKKEIRV